ncbi:MAG: acyl-CoA thioesterase [Flavobacteriaceae bacterium]
MNFTTRFHQVRYAETDQMQFVHHSNYVKYFEMARIEWLDALGVSYAQMEREGLLMPVVSVAMTFKKPLHFGDSFKVKVSLKKPPLATLEFDYAITNQAEEEICTGSTVLAFITAEKNKAVRCPKIILDQFT